MSNIYQRRSGNNSRRHAIIWRRHRARLDEGNYLNVLDKMEGFALFYGVTGGRDYPRIFVTNLNDDGAGSLRAALIAAGAAGGGWISFTSGMSGIIQLEATAPGFLRYFDNITIDGRGSDITVRGQDAGSTPIIKAGRGEQNIIVMYMKFLGSATVTESENDDGLQHENDTTDLPTADDNFEFYWFYHIEITDTEDELISLIRTRGRGTVQECYFLELNTFSFGILISHGSADDYGWDAIIMENTFCRNHYDCYDRTPMVTNPAFTHSYNNYISSTIAGPDGRMTVITRFEGAVDSNDFLSEGDIFDNLGGGGPRWLKPTQGVETPGQVRVEGALLLNSASNDERNRSSVANAPYTFPLLPASLELRDAIVVNAGWRDTPYPLD